LVTPEPGEAQENSLKAIHSFCERIEVVPVLAWRRFWRLGQVPFTSLPLQTLYFFDPSLRQRVRSLLQSQSFDLIHVQLVRMAPVIDGLSGQIPKVLDLIDALSVNMARRAQRKRGLQAGVAAWEARRIQRYERVLVQKYDRVIVSSPVDRSAIGEFPNLHVVPNGVDIQAHSFNADGRESATIIFTGSMWYFPNVDAISWFIGSVFPLVRQQVPNAQVFIVGANPKRGVQRLSRFPGVIVTGYVPSVQDYLSRATIAVAPMQGGSGMQFKVIEAMASGTPVVATSYALGGLEAVDGEHLLIAQDTTTFASQVVRLLRSSELQRRLAHNARKLVEEKYAWERTVVMLEAVHRLATER
jgi:sugar transferase (PEP-CTERM/EpsH1 system associated)